MMKIVNEKQFAVGVHSFAPLVVVVVLLCLYGDFVGERGILVWFLVAVSALVMAVVGAFLIKESLGKPSAPLDNQPQG